MLLATPKRSEAYISATHDEDETNLLKVVHKARACVM